MDPVQAKKDYTLVVILSFTTILGVVIAAFFYFQNQQLRKQLLVTPSPVATVLPTPAPTLNSNLPQVTTPVANSIVTSPLKVTGTVPTGWMFEGNFPIKLIDSKKKVLVQTIAKEDIAGSWQQDTPASFSATLTFKNATGSGTLILEKDNPSGLPQNATTFEVPIQF